MSIGSVYWEEEVARRREKIMPGIKKRMKRSEREKERYTCRRAIGDPEGFDSFFMISYESPFSPVYLRTCSKIDGEWIYERSKAKQHIGI